MAFEFHADSFMTKPVEIQRLAQMIHDHGQPELAGHEKPQPAANSFSAA
jgi:hypothetical protein